MRRVKVDGLNSVRANQECDFNFSTIYDTIEEINVDSKAEYTA